MGFNKTSMNNKRSQGNKIQRHIVYQILKGKTSRSFGSCKVPIEEVEGSK